MGLFDTVHCNLPLPDPNHQDLEYQTKDLERLLDIYTITAEGRMIRHARTRAKSPSRDIEWPVHGDVRIYAGDPEKERGLIEYEVRFTYGWADAIRRLDEKREPLTDWAKVSTTADSGELRPAIWGRRLTLEEYHAYGPEKIELIHGEIPGAEKLLMLLLTQIGLRRAAMLVGAEHWKEAIVTPPSV
jgi:hypothetical protein